MGDGEDEEQWRKRDTAGCAFDGCFTVGCLADILGALTLLGIVIVARRARAHILFPAGPEIGYT